MTGTGPQTGPGRPLRAPKTGATGRLWQLLLAAPLMMLLVFQAGCVAAQQTSGRASSAPPPLPPAPLPAPSPAPAAPPIPQPPSGGITLSKDMTGAQIQQQLGRLQRGELPTGSPPMGSPPTTTVARPYGLAARTEAENIAAQIEILNVEIRDFTIQANGKHCKQVWATFRNKGPRPVAEIWGDELFNAVPGGIDGTHHDRQCHFAADERLPPGAPPDPNGDPAPMAPGQTITNDVALLFGDLQGNFPTQARVTVNRAYQHGTFK